MIKCKICGKEYNNRKSLGSHLCKSHKEITTKEYYDKYFLIVGEDKCKNKNCKNKTKQFKGLTKGYKKSYCCISCARSSEEVINKQKQTCLEKYNNPNYRNLEQYEKTCLEKYGAKNSLCKNTEPYKKKIKTVNEKYGVDNVFSNDEICKKIRKTNEHNGRWQNRDEMNIFSQYYEKVKIITRKNKKELLINWNGFDFYDGEYIKNNFDLDKNDNNYPSIDHIMSIKDCFIKNILPEKCSEISNLCFTKRIINILKSVSDIKEFKKIINEKTK